uniref:Hypothetical secreted protein n=1 Tax=Hottentotta judaicus TaxID=6863 RepID=F1CJ66_HOTJU|nr:hypothetical secreted protein [Hottentotta judaicus]
MVFLKFVSIVVVALVCGLFTVGQNIDYEENEVWGKNKENSFETKCVEKFLRCLISSNYTIKWFINAEKKCCVRTLNDSQDIWFLTFHHCVSELTIPITKICLFKSGFRCMIRIEKYFQRTFSDYLQFEKDFMDRIQPRPTTSDECDDSFIKNYDNAFIEQCKVNTDKNLYPLCNTTTVLFKKIKQYINILF